MCKNCLLFHVIKEEQGGDTDSIITKTIKEEMDIEVLANDIDRSLRFGKGLYGAIKEITFLRTKKCLKVEIFQVPKA